MNTEPIPDALEPVSFPAPTERYVDLPLHLYAIKDRRCVYCGEQPLWESFEAYVAWWFASEYEGEPGHVHDEREEWEYLNATCLKAAES